MNNKRALGRGLNTLLPRRAEPGPHPEPAPNANPSEIPIDYVVPNPYQPRRHFDPQALKELADSIETNGIIQPLIVRKRGDRYELIAGERRWRAARLAGLANIPVHIQERADNRMLEVALIENIQREDLNPLETATAFHRLNEELSLTHEEIGQRTGKDRATVANFIRLLQLPEEIQKMIAERKLSPGHARPLLRIPNAAVMVKLATQIVENGWSVRRVEEALAAPDKPAKSAKPAEVKPVDPNVRAATESLERALGTRVRIVEGIRGKGTVEIDYFSPEDLDRIYTLIAGENG